MKRFRTTTLLALLLLRSIVPASAAGASDSEGTLHGKVLDPQGAALPGVTVTAKSPDGTLSGSAVTDSEGQYRITVPPGPGYSVSGNLPGFTSPPRSGIDLAPGQTIDTDIRLELASLNSTVTVLGEEVTRSRVSVERVQDVPLSISVVAGKELERLEASDISALVQRAANVSWNFGNQRTSSLSIRGIGKQGQTEAQDPSVGVVVDGVSYAYNALTSSFDFTDVDSVEVTRGPQGTLLGKNTTLGVLNVTTRRPTFANSAEGAVTFGQSGALIARAAVGGPVNSWIAWRSSFSVTKAPGDMPNLYNRDITFTNRDRASGRIQFLFLPSAHFSARLAVDFQPRGGETTNGRTVNLRTPSTYSNGTATNLTTDASTRLARRWFAQQSSYTYENSFLNGGGQNAVNNDNARPLVTGSNGATVDLNWYFGDYTITSITAYRDYHFNATNDDGTPFDIYRNAGGFWNDYRQLSQEARINSRLGRLLNYQAGLYFIQVINDVDYRREWGNDAGAWFANPAQYSHLDADAAGRYLLQQSLDRLSMSFNSPIGVQHITNNSVAPFAQANWHLTSALTLTTGARLTHENRQNQGFTLVKDYGNAPELNPPSVNGVQMGGFDSTSTGALTSTNTTDQLNLADQVSNKYFGTAIGAVPGSAYSSLSPAQRQQVADAKNIRQSNIGVVFNPADAQEFKAVQPSFVISPTYKISENLTAYVSWQYGEKAGISQFTNGISKLVASEENRSYEAGSKSVLFNHKLVLNTAAFLTDIRNYQQSVRVLDVYTTNLNNNGILSYTSATGNVPKVRAKGIEVDGGFSPVRSAAFRFSGAFNDARYKYFPNSAQPVENGYTGADPYRDVSGQTLPGAAKWTFNSGVDYRYALSEELDIRTSFNTAFTSRYKSDNSLSDYSWVPGHSTTDFSIGIARGGERLNVSLLVKNLFNDKSYQTQSWNSYSPAVPRWIGVQITSKVF